MRSAISRCAALTAGISLVGSGASAEDTRLTYLEVSAAAGYSTSPFLTSDGGGAGFGNASIRAVHQSSNDRTSTELIGYLEGSAYTSGYSPSTIASARAQVTHSVSERLSISGSASFSADFAGQLSNRFVYAPAPGAPITQPVAIENPDLYIYNGRQYRFDGNVGATWQASERSRITANAGADHVAFSRSGLNDYTLEFASLGYDRLLSRRTTVGLELTGSRTEFSRSDDVTTIINPAATLSTRLSEDWTLSGSAGVMFSSLNHASQTIKSTDPSFSATLCKQAKNESLCATATRAASSSAAAELVNSSSVEVEWLDRLDRNQTVQLSAGYIRFDNTRIAQAALADEEYHAAGSYSRLLNQRCSVGANVGIRGFSEPGTAHRTDLSASVFVRYRLGDLG